MTKTEQIIQRWRDLSPADWAESEYGWILPSGKLITLADWQRAVLDAWFANWDVSILAVSAPNNIPQTHNFTPQGTPQHQERIMNALPITGELFATNQVSPETERCYKYQLRNFAQ